MRRCARSSPCSGAPLRQGTHTQRLGATARRSPVASLHPRKVVARPSPDEAGAWVIERAACNVYLQKGPRTTKHNIFAHHQSTLPVCADAYAHRRRSAGGGACAA